MSHELAGEAIRSPQYVIREYDSRDMAAVLELMRQSLGAGPTGVREEGFWRWKHIDNHFGTSLMLVASDSDGRIIGLRAFMRWRFKKGARIFNAVRPVDTATDPRCRRMGIFSALTRRAVDRAASEHVDFIFNTPNGKSMPGYLKLGWKRISVIRPVVKVLNYPRFIRGIMGSPLRPRYSEFSRLGKFSLSGLPPVREMFGRAGGLEQLLSEQGRLACDHLQTDRSMEYLNWRYANHPSFDYRAIAEGKNGKMSGCIVVRPNIRFRMREVVLDEMLLSDRDERSAASLLSKMEKSVNADYVVACFPDGSFERRVLERHGFRQALVGGMNFVVNTLGFGGPELLDIRNWALSLGDLGVF